MDYQSLYIKTVVELRKIAKDMGVRVPAGTNKGVLINLLLVAYEKAKQEEKAEQPALEKADKPQMPALEQAEKSPEPALEKADAGCERTAESVPAPELPAGYAPDGMRMAAHPQVVDSRGRFVREAPEQAGRYVPRRNQVAQADDRANGRIMFRQDTAAQRYGQSRPVQRQEAIQNPRFNRGEGQAQPVGGRYDQNRYPSNPADNRYLRENARPAAGARNEGMDGEARSWQEEGAEGANYRPDGYRPRRDGYYNEEYRTSNPAVPEMLAAGECGDGAGVLEIQPDGYGFLRAENCLPGVNDVYISIAQIRRFGLRMGDYVEGKTRAQREGDRYTAMMYITRINGEDPETAAVRRRFDELVPVYPDERLRLEEKDESDLSLRVIGLMAPIGKGQRGLIVSPPKAGKTTMLKKIANAITAAHPEVHLIVLLIDERPEEVTDMKRSIEGEVIYSTFDEAPENHARVSEMVLERAKRLVEAGKDVVVLMDSITRLARAYNLTIAPTGRSLSGGLDPGALHKPKKFFGAARNIENGGSLTIIATALVDTGSRMDDIIYEEFKGTGNMEIHLDRKLSDRRIFPAVDMLRSGTRREELLLDGETLECARKVRRMLSGANAQDDAERLMAMMEKSADNGEFIRRLSGMENVYEKMGYTMGGK